MTAAAERLFGVKEPKPCDCDQRIHNTGCHASDCASLQGVKEPRRLDGRHSTRRMLQALDGYWLHCDGLPKGRYPRSASTAEDWWYRFERYRRDVEAGIR